MAWDVEVLEREEVLPELSDPVAWAARSEIQANYMARIAQAATDPEKRALVCQMVAEFYDLSVRSLLNEFTSLDNIDYLQGNLGGYAIVLLQQYWQNAEKPLKHALNEMMAARIKHWTSVAIRKVTPVEVEEVNDRKAAVEAYIREVSEHTGQRFTKTDFWKAASYTCRTEFERWQRNDARTTRSAEKNFARILRQKPHLK